MGNRKDWKDTIETMRSLTRCYEEFRTAADRQVVKINESSVALSIRLAKAAAKLQATRSVAASLPSAPVDAVGRADEREEGVDAEADAESDAEAYASRTPEEILADFAEEIAAQIGDYAEQSAAQAQQSFTLMQAAITMGIASLFELDTGASEGGQAPSSE